MANLQPEVIDRRYSAVCLLGTFLRRRVRRRGRFQLQTVRFREILSAMRREYFFFGRCIRWWQRYSAGCRRDAGPQRRQPDRLWRNRNLTIGLSVPAATYLPLVRGG